VGYEACVVDQDVYAAEFFGDGGRGRADGCVVCDVDKDEGDVALRVFGADFRYGFLAFSTERAPMMVWYEGMVANREAVSNPMPAVAPNHWLDDAQF